MNIGGVPSDYYPIGALAAALNRSPNTIRDWERNKIIPPGLIINGSSRNGRRRLYTGAWIRGLRQLADECGALDNLNYAVAGSEFSQLAFVLFEQLDRQMILTIGYRGVFRQASTKQSPLRLRNCR